VAEVTATLKDLTLATAIEGLEPASKEKIFKMMNHARKRKIEDLTVEKKPSAAEVSTAFIQILTEVRKMITEGMIMLDKVDPELLINSDFEDSLLSGGPVLRMSPDSHSTSHSASMPELPPMPEGASHDHKIELDHLRRTVSQLMVENQKLKERLVAAENKLIQIKKIA
jgi:hypothetical protein